VTNIMGKKILLADDSLTIQKVVELTLAGTDYELTCVSNGQKALESLEHSRPDLILADVVMPEKNGYEVCEAVKGNPATAEIPVLLLSGTFEPFDRDRADRIRADRVVSKPFDAQQLLDQIETLLTRGAGSRAPDSAASRGGSFEDAFLDDTIPTRRVGDRSRAAQSGNTLDHDSAPPAGSDRGLHADWSSRAPAREEVSAEAGNEPPIAETEPAGAEEFSGGPVFLTIPEARETREEKQTRHPVEEAPAPERSPAGPGGEAGIEEISAEEARAFFDVSAAAAPPPPASPPLAASELNQEQIERIAALVVAKLSDRVLREIAWEVVPDVAEMVVKRRIEELEGGVE
jgi:CheY-like chemotaxis protein